MLPARHRLRTADDYRAVLRASGRRHGDVPAGRAGGTYLVVHAALTDPTGARAPRVGFVVSAAVGSAVVRNRTKRRLRHLMAARLDTLPAGADLVVRVLPAAAGVSSADLDADLARVLPAALRRVA